MKTLSSFIKELQELFTKHGDVPVYVPDPEALDDGYIEEVTPHAATKLDGHDKVIGVTICDPETAEAFT